MTTKLRKAYLAMRKLRKKPLKKPNKTVWKGYYVVIDKDNGYICDLYGANPRKFGFNIKKETPNRKVVEVIIREV